MTAHSSIAFGTMVIATALLHQLVQPFSFQELKVAPTKYKNRETSERIVNRFLESFDPKVGVRAEEFTLEEDPELNQSFWWGKTSDGRNLSWRLPTDIKVFDSGDKLLKSLDPNLPVHTEYEAFLMAMQMKQRFGVPACWQLVKDPPILDFGKHERPSNLQTFAFNFALKPPGHLYSTPGRLFRVRIAARGLKTLDVAYTYNGWILPTGRRITKDQAVQKAIAKQKQNGDPKPEVYLDQVGLQNNYLPDQRLFLREVYVVPIRYRRVIFVDSKTGDCSQSFVYK